MSGKGIAINALKDEAEAGRIVEWLKNEINDAWEKRESIVPSFSGKVRPTLMEILKLLPKTNCRECGRPTCMVFAAHAVEGVVGASDCPEMGSENAEKLETYLAGFVFD